jgi:hypothetical protein
MIDVACVMGFFYELNFCFSLFSAVMETLIL